jgi:hypothetical protein
MRIFPSAAGSGAVESTDPWVGGFFRRFLDGFRYR